MLSAGSHLGPYEILARVGAGGMGEVWKARDTRLNRIVAIKQLKNPHDTRFEQEARAIAALNHPHICTLYDVGPDYLVMEFVDGTSPSGPMAAADVVTLARQLAGALEAAHHKGILHRDLKPGNILVAGGSAKLLDFGLAKIATEADANITRTIEGTVVGTVAYMSPEQAQGKPIDARSDVFSFGAVMYELAAGRPAFSGESAAEVLSSVLRDHPSPLSATPLARIVERCLRKQPAQRFQTMRELREALDDLAGGGTERLPSIAVLPFADMSAGKDNEYFSDGLAEEIINALARIKGLRVIARTSAFAFKGQNTDIRRIAETLGVANVLEGSVRKAGERIRVTAQLITASDGSHLWSERYDRDLADVFAVQDEIAVAIAAALKTTLAVGAAPGRQYTPTLPAYEAFLKGRHHLWRITPESLRLSGEYFAQAIAADPQFALAYSGLGYHYFFLAMFSLMPAHQAMPRMRAEAARALELDPSLPDAHAQLGLAAALYSYDWAEAERQFAQAMSHEPVSPFVRNVYATFYLLYLGRSEEAVGQLTCALDEDPLAVNIRYTLGTSLLMAGRLTEGSAQLRRVLELDDKFLTAYGIQAIFCIVHGDLVEGRARAEQAFALAPWDPVVVGLLAGIEQRAGDAARARRLMSGLGDGSAFGAPIGFVLFALVCGEIDSAADWIVKAIEQRYPGILFFIHLPLGDALKASPRWPALAALMNLPSA